MSEQAIRFLLVEDDELDAEAFQRVIQKRELNVELQIAQDGFEALEVLRDQVRQGDANLPLVFLDLNMPGMNGHEFLKELRGDEALSHTVVFVLTSSAHERDVRMAYEKNVAGYFLKPEVDGCLTTISRYLEATRLPCHVG